MDHESRERRNAPNQRPNANTAPAGADTRRRSADNTRRPAAEGVRSRSASAGSRTGTAAGTRPAPRKQPAAPKKKKKKYRKVINTNFRVKFLTMLAVVAAIILGFTIFFKIQKIEVRDNQYYTAEEIIAASGVETGDNLLTIGKQTVAARIIAQLPYVSEVQLKRSLPSTLIVTVGEFEVTYGILDSSGAWWLINREGRVLNTTDESEVKSHIQVQGLVIDPPKIGDEITPQSIEGTDASEVNAKKNAVIKVLTEMEPHDFVKQIVSLDVSTSYDIVIWYGTQFKIRLGSNEELDYKMTYLEGVLKELNSYQSGVIDLTFAEEKAARFQPFK